MPMRTYGKVLQGHRWGFKSILSPTSPRNPPVGPLLVYTPTPIESQKLGY